MPATTPNHAYPYPVAADTADIPRDIKALTDKLDADAGFGTTLPASPVDGQIYYYIANSTLGIVWQLRYRASVLKWENIGGTPLYAEANASVVLPATVADFSDGQPTITLPVAGEYLLEFGAGLAHTSGSQVIYITPLATGLAYAAGVNSLALGQGSSPGVYAAVSRKLRATGISGTLKLQSQAGATGGSADRRWLSARLIRI